MKSAGSTLSLHGIVAGVVRIKAEVTCLSADTHFLVLAYAWLAFLLLSVEVLR